MICGVWRRTPACLMKRVTASRLRPLAAMMMMVKWIRILTTTMMTTKTTKTKTEMAAMTRRTASTMTWGWILMSTGGIMLIVKT